MCGICGSLFLDRRSVDHAGLDAMLAAMVHRGPDSEGRLVAPGLVAGARRLAVIDLEGGGQPLASEDGSVRVVFNGEIYNYRELAEELTARGHRFRTRSDTEVLVHLWEENGPEMVHRLNGMFAFCLWDERSGQTFLARDRIGIKPLYYRHSGDRLDFASELAVLLRHPEVPAEIDTSALCELFCLQYLSGDRTVYHGLKKLLPGHAMLAREGELRVYRYYGIPHPGSADGDPPDLDELRQLLDDSVRRRKLSDVPLGIFLSGGLDSAIVLGLLSRLVDRPVQTFSVGFDGDAAFDERAFARQVARQHGAEHHELLLSASGIAEELPRIIDHLAEPVLDPATIPTWLLSRFARRQVTVVLTGEGADELFAGYRRYLYQDRLGWASRAAALGRPLRGVLPRRVGQALDAVGETDPVRNHLEWSSVIGRRVARRLIDRSEYDAFERRVTAAFAPYFTDTTVRLADQQRADQHEWLPHNLLAKIDRASMAFSLEARVPFLDHRVVEWAAALPDSMRIRRGVTKIALREAFRDLVPARILRRPKRGFDLPLASWIRGPLRTMACDLLAPDNLKRWDALERNEVTAMLDAHLRNEQDYGLPLFNLLSIMVFLEQRESAGPR